MSCQGCAAVCCLLPCISWAFWGHDYWFTLSFFEFGVLSYALFSCSSISSINTLLSLVFRFSRFSFLLPALMFLVSCLCVVFPLCYFRFCFVSFCRLHQFPCCCTCKAVVTFPEQLCVFILSVQCCIILLFTYCYPCLPTLFSLFGLSPGFPFRFLTPHYMTFVCEEKDFQVSNNSPNNDIKHNQSNILLFCSC